MVIKLKIFIFFLFCVLLHTVCSATTQQSPPNSISIYNQGSAQFELSCKDWPNIFIDVIDSTMLQVEATPEDILLVTHSHPDHYDSGFADSFPGDSLVFREGNIPLVKGEIISLASTHSDSTDDTPLTNNGSNYIFLINMCGVRIAHLGDIGQAELSGKQLDKLGRVDIAITQFINPLSQMNMKNKKAFNLMNQLSPKIIIPTAHGRFNEEMINYAKTILEVYASEEEHIVFSKETLPTKSTLLVWGDGASFMMDDLGLKEWQDVK